MSVNDIKVSLERVVVGPIGTNCYFLTNITDKVSLVVDPGDDAEILKNCIDAIAKDYGSKIEYIVNTHGHWDHTSANQAIKDYTGAKLLIHKADAPKLTKDETGMFPNYVPCQADDYLEDGQVLMLGTLPITIIHTPGHSKGGICLFFKEKYLICGDTLFKYSIGRTDFPDGSFTEIIDSIKTKLLPLGDEVEAFPGHGPETTIAEEKQMNTFLR